MEEIEDKIRKDIDQRGRILGYVIETKEEENVQIIEYNKDGLVKFLSSKAEKITVYQNLRGGGIANLCTVGKIREPENKEEGKKNKDNNKALQDEIEHLTGLLGIAKLTGVSLLILLITTIIYLLV